MDYKKVINGNYGQLWLDGDLLGEVKSFQAKITLIKADVKVLGDPNKHSKVIGYESKGTLKLNKISDRIALKLHSSFTTGVMIPCTIVAELNDPSSYGASRIALFDVIFDELTLMDFEGDKLVEEDANFTFAGFQLIDTIAPPQ